VIYIDQPIGTGFSFGTDTVNSTDSAAPFVWTAFQVLFESPEFSKFQKREYVAEHAPFLCADTNVSDLSSLLRVTAVTMGQVLLPFSMSRMPKFRVVRFRVKRST